MATFVVGFINNAEYCFYVFSERTNLYNDIESLYSLIMSDICFSVGRRNFYNLLLFLMKVSFLLVLSRKVIRKKNLISLC